MEPLRRAERLVGDVNDALQPRRGTRWLWFMLPAFGILLTGCAGARNPASAIEAGRGPPEAPSGGNQAPPPLSAGWPQHDPKRGIWILTPQSWFFLKAPSGPANPPSLFATANYPIEPGGSCAPTRALEALPEHGVLAWMVEHPETADFPSRPERFSLDPESLGTYDCSGDQPAYTFSFEDRGRHLQAYVALGDDATAETVDLLLASLSSLVVDRCPPAEPPQLVSEFGSLVPEQGSPGDEVVISGPTGRDGNWFWAPIDRIEVWWSVRRIDLPEENEEQVLLASFEPKTDCSFSVRFPVPESEPGRYVITVLAHRPHEFGWMGVHEFNVLVDAGL